MRSMEPTLTVLAGHLNMIENFKYINGDDLPIY